MRSIREFSGDRIGCVDIGGYQFELWTQAPRSEKVGLVFLVSNARRTLVCGQIAEGRYSFAYWPGAQPAERFTIYDDSLSPVGGYRSEAFALRGDLEVGAGGYALRWGLLRRSLVAADGTQVLTLGLDSSTQITPAGRGLAELPLLVLAATVIGLIGAKRFMESLTQR
jgi:hypothetical protein